MSPLRAYKMSIDYETVLAEINGNKPAKPLNDAQLGGYFLPEHSLTLTRPEPIPVFGQKETPAPGTAAKDGRRNSGVNIDKVTRKPLLIKHLKARVSQWPKPFYLTLPTRGSFLF